MVSDNRMVHMLTVREVARLLNIHTNTVRRWSNRGILKAYHINDRGDRRFSRDDIIHFLVELKSHEGNEKEASLSGRQAVD